MVHYLSIYGKHVTDKCHLLHKLVQTPQQLFYTFCKSVRHDERNCWSYELMMERTPKYRMQEKIGLKIATCVQCMDSRVEEEDEEEGLEGVADMLFVIIAEKQDILHATVKIQRLPPINIATNSIML